MSNQQALFGSATQPGLFKRYVTRFDDGEIMRCAFYGLLIGAAMVIGLDIKALYDERAALDPLPTGGTVYVEPVLPPAVRTGTTQAPSVDPRENVTLDGDALRTPMTFELRPGGVLAAEGSIDLGAADRFASEIEARGEYVRTLSLNSPGGSLEDAMAIARLARDKGLSTQVPDGALCASSCPLVMAGGVVRTAGEKAAIGLHQFYAATNAVSAPAQAMSDAQATAARISRYLMEMDVDPTLWLHALDTPPQSLYYLSPDELAKYRLVTSGTPVASR
ncbi:hypothetical protein [Mesorhizobium sp. CAU 1732]|uniref:COG3904 family protein n=1 Tax=Mesorhizobium sp. CAU 1732 TaxID=3140358 RepID=UPI0032607A74